MARKNIKWLVPAVLMALVGLNSALAQTSTSYELKWSTISSGGGETSSTSYVLNGTIGQSIAGRIESTSYTMWAGFWFPGGGGGVVPVETIDEAKLLADGTQVSISSKIATTSESDFNWTGCPLYIEEEDRSSGIRVAVATAVPMLARGNKVDVQGKMATTSAGEREIAGLSEITDPTVTIVDYSVTADLDPLGMNNRSLGGGGFGNPPAGQYGVAGGNGTNNVGLLVKSWGTVTQKGTGYLVIDDGSGVPVRVDATGVTNLPNVNAYVKVVGISSLYKPGAARERLILARDGADIISP